MNHNPVESNELLARTIVHGSWVRSDLTLRQNGFMPDSTLDLSVVRHVSLGEDEIWKYCEMAVGALPRKFLGRGDVRASAIPKTLHAVPRPEQDNPNHAGIVGWSPYKESRKGLALELAAAAGKMIPAPIVSH